MCLCLCACHLRRRRDFSHLLDLYPPDHRPRITPPWPRSTATIGPLLLLCRRDQRHDQAMSPPQRPAANAQKRTRTHTNTHTKSLTRIDEYKKKEKKSRKKPDSGRVRCFNWAGPSLPASLPFFTSR